MSSLLEKAQFFGQTFAHAYLSRAGPFFTKDQYPDLSGQTWVVTGATGGIGLALAKILVEQNAHVWLVGRSEAKLQAAQQTLRETRPLARVDYAVVDYNDLATVQPGLQPLLASEQRLDGVIHNAGVMHVPRGSRTKQDIEQHLGVNVVATQLVQDVLDPLVAGTRGARIVWLSSAAHLIAPRNGFDLAGTDSAPSWRLYGQTKALNYIQAVQWTRKHPDADVKAVAVHPGIIRTDITRWSSSVDLLLLGLLQYELEYGTYSPIYAALSPDAANNAYIVPWGRPGLVRPDVYRAAHGAAGAEADRWIEEKIAPFK